MHTLCRTSGHDHKQWDLELAVSTERRHQSFAWIHFLSVARMSQFTKLVGRAQKTYTFRAIFCLLLFCIRENGRGRIVFAMLRHVSRNSDVELEED